MIISDKDLVKISPEKILLYGHEACINHPECSYCLNGKGEIPNNCIEILLARLAKLTGVDSY